MNSKKKFIADNGAAGFSAVVNLQKTEILKVFVIDGLVKSPFSFKNHNFFVRQQLFFYTRKSYPFFDYLAGCFFKLLCYIRNIKINIAILRELHGDFLIFCNKIPDCSCNSKS